MKYKFCPMCAKSQLVEVTGIQHCTECDWTHYDNPIPVAVVMASYEGDTERRIVLVQRKNPPFPGQWALPGGFMNRNEIPKVAAVREMMEETGLVVRLEKVLCVCNPMPGELNQIIVSYLGRITGGELKAGDDALDAKLFKQEDMPIPCFRSHKMLVGKWWEKRFGEITGNDLD